MTSPRCNGGGDIEFIDTSKSALTISIFSRPDL
jgi:hypothetical protein